MNEQHKKSHGQPSKKSHDGHASTRKPYWQLALSLALSFVLMYFVMYAMADRWDNVYLNLSNVYMTGLMAGSMLPVMLATMPGMFPDKRLNRGLWGAALLMLGTSWFLLRAEAGVGDRQFLRAMIPHHAAALQMCNASALSDPRVQRLCDAIFESQKREIAEMKAILEETK
jgi:hypothetical protein